MTTTKLPEKYRYARNIQEGYEIRLTDGTWAKVTRAVHINAPLAVSYFTVNADGVDEHIDAFPREEIMSRHLGGNAHLGRPAPTFAELPLCGSCERSAASEAVSQ